MDYVARVIEVGHAAVTLDSYASGSMDINVGFFDGSKDFTIAFSQADVIRLKQWIDLQFPPMKVILK